jgi:hypothetical protein
VTADVTMHLASCHKLQDGNKLEFPFVALYHPLAVFNYLELAVVAGNVEVLERVLSCAWSQRQMRRALYLAVLNCQTKALDLLLRMRALFSMVQTTLRYEQTPLLERPCVLLLLGHCRTS